MKCFTVKIGDSRFIKDVPRVIVNSWNSKGISTVSDTEEAKHYKSKGQANAWLKSAVKSAVKTRLKKEKELDKIGDSQRWWKDSLKKDVKFYKELKVELGNAFIVELDIEIPNFYSKDGIKFDKNRQWYQGMNLYVDTTSRYHCKSCGVKLKNIPYYMITNSNQTKICVGCLSLREENIKKAFDGMDEDHRNELVSELVLGQI
jgi:hypothetical protein